MSIQSCFEVRRPLAPVATLAHALCVNRHVKYDFDVAVIGGGSAGYASARVTANAGLKTIVIEGGREVGGLCILRGCMPSKALLYAAEVRHLAQRAHTWGIKIKSVGFDITRVMNRKAARIGEFADYRRHQ